MAPKTSPWETRFLRKIDSSDEDGCWVWTAAKDRDGYGVFSRTVGRQERAHRIYFEMINGPIPEGVIVRHACDNPSCVAPSHLELGTVADNNRDRDLRRRTSRGSSHYRAKLSVALGTEIRERYRAGRPKHAGNASELMADYEISRSTLYRVLKRELWT